MKMFNLLVMERCFFLKSANGIVSIQVSERLYEEIMHCLKISEEQLTAVLREAGDKEVYSISGEPDEKMSEDQISGNSIFIKDRDYFRRIEFGHIRWVEASGSYCCLYLDNAPKIMLSFNLRELAMHLPSRIFMRVHRSYMVNIGYIDSFIGNILCIGENRIPVSKQHKKSVLSRLNVLGNVK